MEKLGKILLEMVLVDLDLKIVKFSATLLSIKKMLQIQCIDTQLEFKIITLFYFDCECILTNFII